jgi:hypothetical protein
MSSEWLKVMLDEIARKKAESEQAQVEEERRRAEHQRDGVVVESKEYSPRKNIGDAE